MIRVISLAFCMLLTVSTASAQAPGSVHIMLPNGASYVQSTATSGTLSSGGITCTWSTGTNSASISFVGNFTTGWIYPSIDLAWFSTSVEQPTSMTITEVGASGTYDFSAPFYVGGWDSSIDYNGLSGDWSWAYAFPVNERFDLEIGMNDQGTDYNLAFVIEWGEGVPADAGSWDQVKALYR